MITGIPCAIKRNLNAGLKHDKLACGIDLAVHDQEIVGDTGRFVGRIFL
jgi:hypothetical protein